MFNIFKSFNKKNKYNEYAKLRVKLDPKRNKEYVNKLSNELLERINSSVDDKILIRYNSQKESFTRDLGAYIISNGQELLSLGYHVSKYTNLDTKITTVSIEW